MYTHSVTHTHTHARMHAHTHTHTHTHTHIHTYIHTYTHTSIHKPPFFLYKWPGSGVGLQSIWKRVFMYKFKSIRFQSTLPAPLKTKHSTVQSGGPGEEGLLRIVFGVL